MAVGGGWEAVPSGGVAGVRMPTCSLALPLPRLTAQGSTVQGGTAQGGTAQGGVVQGGTGQGGTLQGGAPCASEAAEKVSGMQGHAQYRDEAPHSREAQPTSPAAGVDGVDAGAASAASVGTGVDGAATAASDAAMLPRRLPFIPLSQAELFSIDEPPSSPFGPQAVAPGGKTPWSMFDSRMFTSCPEGLSLFALKVELDLAPYTILNFVGPP